MDTGFRALNILKYEFLHHIYLVWTLYSVSDEVLRRPDHFVLDF